MPDSFDALQAQIVDDARKIYPEQVIDHALNPRNLGEIANADGYARVTGPCGDTLEIWVKVRDHNIVNCNFMTDGCGTSIASGSMVTELATGKDTGEALAISDRDVLAALGGLPRESEHCALLAATTLKAALRDYIELQREPWKKSYRKGGQDNASGY